MGFQKQVYAAMAIALAGDLATANPRASYPAPEGGFMVGAAGLTPGRFAWIDADGKTVNNTGTGKPQGIIPRLHQGLITAYLAESGNLIPQGTTVDLLKSADIFVVATVNAATRGQKAFAKLSDGTVRAANAGTDLSGAGFIETDWEFTRDCLAGEVSVIARA